MSTVAEGKELAGANGAIAKQEPKKITNLVKALIDKHLEDRQIVLPSDYSAENALKSAWFYIQNSDQRDKLMACTEESKANALYDMVLQGLDPAKKQCCFIPYGNRMTMQRMIAGDLVVAKRVMPGHDFYSDVIYEGETFSVKKVMTRVGLVTVVAEHVQPFPRKTNAQIIGAYVGTVDTTTGEDLGITLMDAGQVKQSWKKSKLYSPTSATFHNEQPDQAFLRTVGRRHTKPIINSSTDAALLASVRRQDEEATFAEVDEDAEAHANGQIITMEPEPPALEVVSASSASDVSVSLEGDDLVMAIEALGLNADQKQNASDRLAALEQPLPYEQFIGDCARSGDKNWDDVNARLKALEDPYAE